MAMVKRKEVVGRFDVSELREIGSGAAPLGKDVMDERSKVFPQAMILQVSYCVLIEHTNVHMCQCYIIH